MTAPRNERNAAIVERPMEAEMAPDVVSSSFVITSGMTSGVGGSGQAIIVQALKPFSPQVQRLHPSDAK